MSRDVSVVVVEDHDDSREFLVLALQTFGARVIGARTATHALRYMRTVKPDVLVTDLPMPEQDGFELSSVAWLLPVSEDVPAIAVAGHGDLREKIGRSGFQWFMRNDALELCRVFGALIRGGRAHPE